MFKDLLSVKPRCLRGLRGLGAFRAFRACNVALGLVRRGTIMRCSGNLIGDPPFFRVVLNYATFARPGLPVRGRKGYLGIRAG